jgi:hypothetical protein
MKYIKEYYEHSTYERIWLFKYDNSPTYDKLKTFTKSDINIFQKIINKISWPQFFKYRSIPELQPFWYLDWPILFNISKIDYYDEGWEKWSNKWKEIADHNISNNKTDPIYKNKQMEFICQTECDYFRNRSFYAKFRIEIMCDDDGYYYVQIDLQGDKKHYKCDQEYGLSDCIKTELKNWKMPN